YLYGELFIPMFSREDEAVEKYRLSTGIEYSLSKKHSIEAEYIFEHDYRPDLVNSHILSICYNLKF
ncbi:MAG: hypothetical protein NTZ85_08420, partial [Bacteroidia bacterium]|nr:hypothetical protein [Bacteroidia bacterium]